MKRLGLPLLALVALILAGGAAWKWRTIRNSTTPPQLPPAADYQHTVGAVGLVEASSENISISTAVSGLVVKVYVKAGDRVKAGQYLFSLDDRDLQAEIATRKAALDAARERLTRLEASPRPEEIPPAEARVREAEAALADATVQQKLIESVSDRRAIREEDLQRRRQATNAAAAKLDEAKAALALLKAGAWAPDVKIAKADLASAETQVKKIQTDIDRLTMRAPVTGEILQVNVRAREYAQVGTLNKPLIIMGDTSKLNVRFEPYVIPIKSLTGDSTERVDTRVLQVIYRFKDPKVPFRVGQQMDVFISTNSPDSLASVKRGAR